MTKDVDIIVGGLAKPGERGRKPMPSQADDSESDPDDKGSDGYDAAKESMTAFMDAVKGDDVDAALDAWDDVKSNC